MIVPSLVKIMKRLPGWCHCTRTASPWMRRLWTWCYASSCLTRSGWAGTCSPGRGFWRSRRWTRVSWSSSDCTRRSTRLQIGQNYSISKYFEKMCRVMKETYMSSIEFWLHDNFCYMKRLFGPKITKKYFFSPAFIRFFFLLSFVFPRFSLRLLAFSFALSCLLCCLCYHIRKMVALLTLKNLDHYTASKSAFYF